MKFEQTFSDSTPHTIYTLTLENESGEFYTIECNDMIAREIYAIIKEQQDDNRRNS